MSLQGDEQDLKRRLMEEVPQEPITADPREDDEDEDVPEEDDEHGGQARRLGQRVELGGARR
jgi:hypothetical protein